MQGAIGRLAIKDIAHSKGEKRFKYAKEHTTT